MALDEIDKQTDEAIETMDEEELSGSLMEAEL